MFVRLKRLGAVKPHRHEQLSHRTDDVASPKSPFPITWRIIT